VFTDFTYPDFENCSSYIECSLTPFVTDEGISSLFG